MSDKAPLAQPPKWTPDDLCWLSAVTAADTVDWLHSELDDKPSSKRSDTTLLTEKLRSNAPISPLARDLIANLLERHQLKKRRGGRRLPAYTISLAEAMLEGAAAEFRLIWSTEKKSAPADGRYVSIRRDELVKLVARKWNLNPTTLHNFLDGRRGASRRRRRRT